MKKIVCLLLVFLMTFSYALADGQEIKDYILSNYTKALSMAPLSTFNGYCAACVAYQGMAMGIHKSYVWCNGNEAFRTYSAMAKTSGGWLTKSYDESQYSMKEVLLSQNSDSFDVPWTPVVLGFNTGTASNAGQTYGHAMMIYAVRDGVVYFADSTEPVLSDNVHSLSIDDFCVMYSDKPDTPKHEFTYDGAVVFYKSAPGFASVKSSLSKAFLWQNIKLNFFAPSATSYSIGIDRAGRRISTIHTDKPFYNLAFGEEGTYTLYISACNSYGFTDSAPITITVGSKPVNPVIYSDKTKASQGETISFFYGADFATSYSVGITKPDGTKEIVQTHTLPELKKDFSSPGTYKIFASCCNVIGYVDTETLTFEITK